MSLLVILGAGASYDSDANRRPEWPGLENRPPLAAELFGRHPQRSHYAAAINRYPRCAAIVAALGDLATNTVSIEERLAELEEALLYAPLRPQLAATRLYIRDVIRDVTDAWFGECNRLTNQLRLVAELDRYAQHRRPVRIVTFNYDRLIELAMEDALNRSFDRMGGYTADERLQLFKPHGSVDWRQRVTGATEHNFMGSSIEDIDKQLVEFSQTMRVVGDFEVRGKGAPVWGRDNPRDLWIPALAMPTTRKQVFTDASDSHISLLRESLRDVTRILVIGWRAAEGHFLDLLDEELPFNVQLTVVAENVNAAEATAAALTTRLRSQITHKLCLGTTFSGFVTPAAKANGRPWIAEYLEDKLQPLRLT